MTSLYKTATCHNLLFLTVRKNAISHIVVSFVTSDVQENLVWHLLKILIFCLSSSSSVASQTGYKVLHIFGVQRSERRSNMNHTAPVLKGFAINGGNIACAVFKLRNIYKKFTVG